MALKRDRKPRRLLQAEKSLEWEISPIGGEKSFILINSSTEESKLGIPFELSDESDIIIPPSQFHMDGRRKKKKYL